MGEFQVELGFRLENPEDGELDRDVDLLEVFGRELEAIAGEMGPATAIVGDKFTALLTVDATTPVDASRHGVEVVTAAMRSALEERGDELEGTLFPSYEWLHVDAAAPAAV